MSKITLNIVEPGSGPTPIDPGTEPIVPNTGLFTKGIGGPEATIITISIVVILAIVAAAVLYYKKKHSKENKEHKANKANKLANALAMAKAKKKVSIPLAALALVISLGTLAALLVNAGKSNTNAAEGGTENSLTVTESSEELTIEVADEPVFAVLPVELTVEEATDLGYTLTAFADSTDLVSTTDSSNTIPMVTVDTTDIEEANETEETNEVESSDSSTLVPLSPNTYGLSFTNPESALDEVFTSLSTDSTAPTLITDKAYEATEENDTTTIYYGFYITPDVPYGTYVSNSEVVYDAIPNLATVTFDANGLHYNNDESLTTNTLGYKPNVAEAPIELVTGEYLTPAPLSPDSSSSSSIHYTFLGWSEDKDATAPTYTDEQDILANLTLTKNESLTLYAVWHYNTVLSFNGTTSDGGTPIADITIAAGETITLPQNTYTRTGSVFTGWNTVETPTAEDPGESYADQADFTAPDSSADITLYAQWAYTTTITFNGNGADSGSMSDQTIVAGMPETLTPNTFTKTNATFVGWNTVQNPTTENPGTSYSDQAEFTASTTQHEDITLYAQWAYTTISFNGNTSDSGTMAPITIAGGTTSNLPQNTYTKNNCIFTGWNTDMSGTGTSYGNSSPYTASATAKEEFTLYAQWQCISQVNYYGNGATSGQMSSSVVLGGGTLTFPQNSYARDGYIFNGWNTQADGTGTSYPDQGTFTAPMSPATTLNLYAQWKQVFYMQDVATWGSTLSQGDTIEAVDSRDGKTYWVAKLADGNIWMTQNLDLDIDSTKTYTPADTDIPANWMPVRSTTNSTTWDTSLTGRTVPSSYDPGNLYWNGNVTTSSSGTLSNRTTTDPSATSGDTHYHVGNYYNWTAAVAMNSSSSYTTDQQDVNQSICPAGWRLPTYSGDKSYLNLKNAQGLIAGTSGNIQSAPTYFVYGGYWDGSSFYVGLTGNYWSSVVGSSSDSYRLYFDAYGNLYPQNNDVRYSGFSLRCVAR